MAFPCNKKLFDDNSDSLLVGKPQKWARNIFYFDARKAGKRTFGVSKSQGRHSWQGAVYLPFSSLTCTLSLSHTQEEAGPVPKSVSSLSSWLKHYTVRRRWRKSCTLCFVQRWHCVKENNGDRLNSLWNAWRRPNHHNYACRNLMTAGKLLVFVLYTVGHRGGLLVRVFATFNFCFPSTVS